MNIEYYKTTLVELNPADAYYIEQSSCLNKITFWITYAYPEHDSFTVAIWRIKYKQS